MTDTDVGNTAKLIINERWELIHQTSATDNDIYILKTLMSLRLSRPKTRRAIKAGPSLTYGVGDHGLDGTLDLDTTQMTKWGALNKRDANGKMTIADWQLKATALDGTVVTIDFAGVVSIVDFGGTGNDGRLEAIIHIDITDDAPVFA